MHPKLRIYRRNRGKWLYLASTTIYASKEEAISGYIAFSGGRYAESDLRCEYAETHGYDLGDAE